jgi:hypothetical protein
MFVVMSASFRRLGAFIWLSTVGAVLGLSNRSSVQARHPSVRQGEK